MATLKKEVWSINVKGTTGIDATPDISFGVVDNEVPALRLGEHIITGERGMPPATDSGNVLVSVDGEWKAQNGYAFEGDRPELSVVPLQEDVGWVKIAEIDGVPEDISVGTPVTYWYYNEAVPGDEKEEKVEASVNGSFENAYRVGYSIVIAMKDNVIFNIDGFTFHAKESGVYAYRSNRNGHSEYVSGILFGRGDTKEYNWDGKTHFIKKFDNKYIDFPECAVQKIQVDNFPLPIIDGTVTIPLAMLEVAGVVKSSNDDNYINVDENGYMSVNSLHVNKIVQDEGEEIILSCGNSDFIG